MRINIACLALIPWLAVGALADQDQNAKNQDLLERYEAADAFFSTAEDLFLKQDFPGSRARLEQCLSLLPEHSQAHYLMARIDVREGYLHRALKHIQLAETYADLAAHIRGRQQQKLRRELQRMRDEEDSILAGLRENLARTADSSSQQVLLTRIQEAEKIRGSLDARLRSPLPDARQTPAEYLCFHGDVLVRLKRYREAEGLFRSAIEADPTAAESYNRLAYLYLSTARAAKALEVLDEAEAKGLAVDEKLKKDALKSRGKKPFTF
jgi:tetratricopeptide (TPR) repeat protein